MIRTMNTPHDADEGYDGFLNAYVEAPKPNELSAASAIFKTVLFDALQAIKAPWFTISIAGSDKKRVFERRFGAELYRQVQNRFENMGFDFAPDAEIDKRRHPVVKTRAIPDLIVHRAGSMDWNLAVLEIKPIGGEKDGFKKDVTNLQSFVGRDSYFSAFLVVFGPTADPKAAIEAKIEMSTESLRERGVCVVWIGGAGAKAKEL